MRYTHTIFAQPALERLQDSLKKTASHRDHDAETVTEKAAKKKAVDRKAGKKMPAARRARKAEVAS
jgi:hypothetical protein